MAKAATVKDVLYALEYTGDQLCRWPAKAGGRASWSLLQSGAKIAPQVADEVRGHASVYALESTPYGEARYAWQAAAA